MFVKFYKFNATTKWQKRAATFSCQQYVSEPCLSTYVRIDSHIFCSGIKTKKKVVGDETNEGQYLGQ